ncbi:MAG TPA: archease [Actinomycetota bacterium]|nr:archease [Actinomycetota bacterium]
MGGFEHIEHTADVGIRAWDTSLEGCFEQTTLSLLAIMDAWEPGTGERVELELEARDRIALLVDWLSEVLYLQDARDAIVTGIDIERVSETDIKGSVSLVPRGDRSLEGTAVKAITYHKLAIDKDADGWTARVYVDV